MAESYTYKHAIYHSGLNVYIDPAILNVYPESPIAGKIVKTDVGHAYKSLEHENQQATVPILYGDETYYVEEQYICVD